MWNVVHDAYNDCGVFSTLLPGTKVLNVGLCSTDENGDFCYQNYGDAIELLQSESSCYDTYTISGQCTCCSVLLGGISEQGCCINMYHDFIFGLGTANYSPRELYAVCNVDLPADCNNSTLGPNLPVTIPPTTRPTRPATRPTDRPTMHSTAHSFGASSSWCLIFLLFPLFTFYYAQDLN